MSVIAPLSATSFHPFHVCLLTPSFGLNKSNAHPFSTNLPLPSSSISSLAYHHQVTFAEEKNQTILVDTWIDPLIHQYHGGNGHVRFYRLLHITEVFRWIKPDGHNQINFPRTIWIRNVPDAAAEDDDGDIEMLDG